MSTTKQKTTTRLWVVSAFQRAHWLRPWRTWRLHQSEQQRNC